MANIKSQIKRNKQNEKARLRNKAVRSNLKTRIKSAETAAANGAEESEANAAHGPSPPSTVPPPMGVIHKNAAARKKSRLVKRLALSSEDAAS